MGKDTPSSLQKRNLKGLLQLTLPKTIRKIIRIKNDICLEFELEVPWQASFSEHSCSGWCHWFGRLCDLSLEEIGH